MDYLNVKMSSSEKIADSNANNSSENVDKMSNTYLTILSSKKCFQSENEREHSPENIQEFRLEHGQDYQLAKKIEVCPQDIQNANNKVKLLILEF
jgi:hypothetical protein